MTLGLKSAYMLRFMPAALMGAMLVPATAQTWTQKSPANSPSKRAGTAMAYDADRRQVVLFGGYDGGLLGDTWIWDGNNWLEKSPVHSPAPRSGHGMAYDAVRGEVILFGVDGETWTWNGTDWTQRLPAASPAVRANFSMTYDAARGRALVFADEEIWSWDGDNWTPEHPQADARVTHPGGGRRHAMAYDAAHGVTVLHGGFGPNPAALGDTWLKDRNGWTQHSSATAPGLRDDHAMAYDAARGQVVLFGGSNGNSTYLDDTWVFTIDDPKLYWGLVKPPSLMGQGNPNIVWLDADGIPGPTAPSEPTPPIPNASGTWGWDQSGQGHHPWMDIVQAPGQRPVLLTLLTGFRGYVNTFRITGSNIASCGSFFSEPIFNGEYAGLRVAPSGAYAIAVQGSNPFNDLGSNILWKFPLNLGASGDCLAGNPTPIQVAGGRIRGVDFNPVNSQQLVVSGYSNVVTFLNPVTGAMLCDVPLNNNGKILNRVQATYRPDGLEVWAASYEGAQIAVITPPGLPGACTVASYITSPFNSSLDGLNRGTFHPNPAFPFYYITSYPGGKVFVLNTNSKERIREFNVGAPMAVVTGGPNYLLHLNKYSGGTDTYDVSTFAKAADPQSNHIGTHASDGTWRILAPLRDVGQLPDLTLSKSHVGDGFTQGQQGAQYTLTVSNGGQGIATGTITVTDTLPAGLTFVSGSGGGFSCSAVGQAVTCTGANDIGPSGTAAITLAVNVSATAAASLSNSATVSCACGETNTANNNSNTDVVSVTPLPPATTAVTVNTSPPGRSFTVDGAAYTGAQTFSWVPSSTHTIETSSPQSIGEGMRQVFSGWSDGGPISHTITTPASPTTYTASFNTQYLVTCTGTGPFGPAGGACTPQSAWYDSGAIAPVAATANPGFVFTGFSGDLAGTVSPRNVTVDGPKTIGASFELARPGFVSPMAAWGDNSSGQLGDGTKKSRKLPAPVTLLPGAVAIAASDHTLVLKSDGTVWGWGSNTAGQLGNGSSAKGAVTAPVRALNLEGVVAIAAGASHSLALRSDGTVWAWGSNANGQLGTGGSASGSLAPVQVNSVSAIAAVAAAGNQSVALRSDGTVWMWGSGAGNSTVPVQIPGLSTVTAIAAGWQHCLAVRNGEVWSWGSGSALGLGAITASATPQRVSGLTGVAGVAAGKSHSLALMANGSVRSWGVNKDGQLGDGSKTDRTTPVVVVSEKKGKASPATLENVRMLAAGESHSLALTNSGDVLSWGDNSAGQMGVAGKGATTPQEVDSVAGVVAIAAGHSHSVALGTAAGALAGVTIASVPSGIPFEVSGKGCDAATYTTPAAVDTLFGSSCKITFQPPSANGERLAIAGWEDDAKTGDPRTIKIPAVPETFTANFKVQYQLTTAANPPEGGTVSKGDWYDAGATVTVTANAKRGYALSSWTGAVSSGANTATVVMNGAKTVAANFTAVPK